MMLTADRPIPNFESEVNRNSLSYEPMVEKIGREDDLEQYKFIFDYNVRHMSPRQIFDLAGKLHQHKLISDTEYLHMSFQAELHPEYNSTIGKHVGNKAQPDAPRDFVDVWEKKVHRDQRVGSLNMRNSWRILKILQNVESLKKQLSS